MITIDIFSDPVCPWCYIGKKRLDTALRKRPDLDIFIRWRTFQLNPDMPREGMDRQAYLSAKFGGPARAADVYGQIGLAGSRTGIDFKFDRIPRTPNTLLAHRLIAFTQRTSPDAVACLVTLLFEAYFLNGQDIGQEDILLSIAAEAGLDQGELAAYFKTDEDEAEVQAEDALARKLGIGGVPCFIIEGKYALSGAQEAEAFLPLLDMASQEGEAGEKE